MQTFHYSKNELLCENVSVRRLAEEFGTPVYIYSKQSIINNYRRIDKAFGKINHLVAYSVKANGNAAILKLLAGEGSGFDLVSAGELRQAIRAGASPSRCIYAGVGKTEDEIALALKKRILMINIESLPEAETVNRVAGQLKKSAHVAVRINPDVDPFTHRHITTGLKENKFGVAYKRAIEVIKTINTMDHLNFIGLHCHIGSQIMSIQPYLMAANRVLKLCDALGENGIKVENINIGGGFGIDYEEGNRCFPINRLAQHIIPKIKKTKCKLIVEPGRSIVGPAGILLTRLLYVKQGEQKTFYIVDAGMTELIRPSLYDAYHRIQPVSETGHRKTRIKADVVGPVCESSDFFAKDRPLPELKHDSLLAVFDTGAYGFSMSSNYNYRMRPAEILVSGNKYELIRKRDSYAQESRKEIIPK